MRAPIFAATLLLSASLFACGGSSSSGSTVTRTEYDDVAQNVGTSTASSGGDVNAMANVVVMAGGTLPLGFTAGTGGEVSGSLLGIDYDAAYMIVFIDNASRLATAG